MKCIRRVLFRSIASFAMTAASAAVLAQEPVGRPITLVVPFTAGSGTDVIARILSEHLAKELRQPIVVDNRAGAGGTLGASQVAAAPADGHTLLVHSAGHVVNAALYPKLKYDTLKDFAPVALLATLPNVLVVSTQSKVASVSDLVTKARSKPGSMTYASAGNGSATHINAEKFRVSAKLAATHVPYRGTPPALMDVIGGQVDWFFAPLVSAMPLIRDGKLTPLAVGTPERSPVLPDVPTTVEAGFPNSDYTFWVAMFAPAKTAPELVARLNAATVKVLKLPEVKAAMEKLGAQPASSTPKQFTEQLAREFDAAAALIREAGIKLD
ncbi:tripartite tricarboxylate transporter substrate binding protein [Aquincola sp. J276]|uniref:Bug family tripartite tricarboxylate transporter substrate binding protein n=1 Tax=Aquincola sp. J276 TaxID=2898432 RepID=UPI0021508014|nr:tripartite tricarboxylate transporter substrate binding protein [Aquincola sp. J276]MCR5868180.1 tripartite tricarboxylate transporter substrate binding protein [Aquincola sp. J276]